MTQTEYGSSTLVSPSGLNQATMESLIIGGDLGKLSAHDRVVYYGSVCKSLGLNPLTKPFQYIRLNGRLTLYVTKDATEQLRKIHTISMEIVKREVSQDTGLCIVDVKASDGKRSDFGTGAVNIAGLKGEALANAVMKAETKAKRRATLSIVGLGWIDETETDSVPGSVYVDVDDDTGEIIDSNSRDTKVQATMGVVSDLKEKMKKQLVDEGEEIESIRGKIVAIVDSGAIQKDKAVATNGWLKKDHPIEKWRTLHSNLKVDMQQPKAKSIA